jgi:hypothetical protein
VWPVLRVHEQYFPVDQLGFGIRFKRARGIEKQVILDPQADGQGRRIER